jgi:nicotinamide phosphoribosyltransferase
MKHSNNIILSADSYKYSMFNQYPEGTTFVFSYIESRGGEWDKTVFFGLQAYIKEYMLKPVTMEDIDVAEALITAHGEPFYREGWEYIVREYGGKLPVLIKAVPEGSVIPGKNILVSIVNTDPKCFWLTTFLETALLRAVWYPTTVATNSYETKKIIRKYLEKTGDPALIDFKLHDFGARGVSSMESAAIGGAAHLVNFKGTDTVAALLFAREYYNAGIAGFSVPATEHSTITSWGRWNEKEAYRNMVKKNGKPGGIVSVVSDSYDIYNACEIWGSLKEEVIESGATLVVRPDSGDPATVVLECLKILEKHYGSYVNDKGYKVLNNVRVLQGDGINHHTIRQILEAVTNFGDYSADNVVFGQGGALLQQVNRDTLKFAMKCSAAFINDEWVDVFKDPITDQGKKSKKGVLMLVKTEEGYATVRASEYAGMYENVLEPVFMDGKLLRDQTFEEIREIAKKAFDKVKTA